MKRTKSNKQVPIRQIDFKGIKPKKVQFTSEKYMEQFYVYLPKAELTEMPSAALAVYPVLCSFANNRENQPFHISQDNIAGYAGVAIETVKRGMNYLIEAGLVTRSVKQVKKVRMYDYHVQFYRKDGKEKQVSISEARTGGPDDQDLFQFYVSLVKGGIWSKLSADAKLLYIWLRCLASFDIDIYMRFFDREAIEGLDLTEFYKYEYSEREWDILATDNLERLLLSYIYVSKGNFYKALNLVSKYGLITQVKPFEYEDAYLEYECFAIQIKPELNSVEMG